MAPVRARHRGAVRGGVPAPDPDLGRPAALGVCLEVIGAYNSPSLEKLRLWAALSAVVCAVAMLVRALVLTVRLRRLHY